jgi:hypothetical protein
MVISIDGRRIADVKKQDRFYENWQKKFVVKSVHIKKNDMV